MKYDVGCGASFSKTISESDIYQFAGLTGDMNSIHINKEYASKTNFGERIAHGMLVAGLISTVIGTKYPGDGSVYLNQNLKFCAPVKIGDTVTAEVTVLEHINEKKGIIKLNTNVINQTGVLVIKGEAVVQVPEKKVQME